MSEHDQQADKPAYIKQDIQDIGTKSLHSSVLDKALAPAPKPVVKPVDLSNSTRRSSFGNSDK